MIWGRCSPEVFCVRIRNFHFVTRLWFLSNYDCFSQYRFGLSFKFIDKIINAYRISRSDIEDLKLTFFDWISLDVASTKSSMYVQSLLFESLLPN